MKFLTFAISFLLVCNQANAQESAQQLIAGMRPLCLKVVDGDMVRDMAKFSSQPVHAEKVCDCASERLVEDHIVKQVASMSKEQRRALPKARQLSMYMSAKLYSASLTCYADAIRISADNIDVAP